MERVILAAGALALGTTAAVAGGVDRSGQSVAILFEKGTYAELSYARVSPHVSGSSLVPALGTTSGDMAKGYNAWGSGYKQSFNDSFSAALIFDQPLGADVDYDPTASYFAAGSTAKLDTGAFTGLVKYTMPQNISVYGGVRYQVMKAEAVIPFVAGYTGRAERDGSFGYVLGAAYEKPEIALRVAVTYNSKITHKMDSRETFSAGPLAGSVFNSVTESETPESVNIEFQTGVAPDTLVFGSVRWVHWTGFDISPVGYALATGGQSILSYDANSTTYTLGLGHKFNETWSGAVTLGFEEPSDNDGFSSNLGPTDGFWSAGLGGSYTHQKIKISGGIRYVHVGETNTRVGPFAPATKFDSNHAIAAGFKIGYYF